MACVHLFYEVKEKCILESKIYLGDRLAQDKSWTPKYLNLMAVYWSDGTYEFLPKQ